MSSLAYGPHRQVRRIEKDKQLVEDSKKGAKDFIHTDSLMKNLFKIAYGYVMFPNVGKGAIGIGGASGGGIVYEKGLALEEPR